MLWTVIRDKESSRDRLKWKIRLNWGAYWKVLREPEARLALSAALISLLIVCLGT